MLAEHPDAGVVDQHVLLGVVTQVAPGLVNLDQPRAQLAAIVVFLGRRGRGVGAEWPFSGVVQISAAPMHDALKVILAS